MGVAQEKKTDFQAQNIHFFATSSNFLVVSVSVSENLVLGKKGLDIGQNFGLRKKVSVSENLVSEKMSRYQYQKIWSRKKSLGIGLRKFDLGKKVAKKKWAKVAKTCLQMSLKFVNHMQKSRSRSQSRDPRKFLSQSRSRY